MKNFILIMFCLCTLSSNLYAAAAADRDAEVPVVRISDVAAARGIPLTTETYISIQQVKSLREHGKVRYSFQIGDEWLIREETLLTDIMKSALKAKKEGRERIFMDLMHKVVARELLITMHRIKSSAERRVGLTKSLIDDEGLIDGGKFLNDIVDIAIESKKAGDNSIFKDLMCKVMDRKLCGDRIAGQSIRRRILNLMDYPYDFIVKASGEIHVDVPIIVGDKRLILVAGTVINLGRDTDWKADSFWDASSGRDTCIDGSYGVGTVICVAPVLQVNNATRNHIWTRKIVVRVPEDDATEALKTRQGSESTAYFYLCGCLPPPEVFARNDHERRVAFARRFPAIRAWAAARGRPAKSVGAGASAAVLIETAAGAGASAAGSSS